MFGELITLIMMLLEKKKMSILKYMIKYMIK